MVKMPGIMQKIRTLLHLPVLHLNITAVLGRIFLVLLFSTHIVACFLGYLGTVTPGSGWLAALEEEEQVETTVQRRYVLSVSWATSMFFGGETTASPVTMEEYIFALVVTLTVFV